MKIIILGAGQVGGTLAEHLAREENDITVVDTDGAKLRELHTKLDIRTVTGAGSYPIVLRQAGCEDADMLIAVTNTDEINMIACQVAHTLFRTPTKIARVRSTAYLTRKGLFAHEAIPIDVLISPEQVVTDHVRRLIEHPGALQVLEFAGGLVQLVAVKAFYGGPLVGQDLAFLGKHMPNVETRVAAIYRRNRPIIPRGDTVIEADDEVFFLAARRDIRAVMSELRKVERDFRRVVIAGGGNIGERLIASKWAARAGAADRVLKSSWMRRRRRGAGAAPVGAASPASVARVRVRARRGRKRSGACPPANYRCRAGRLVRRGDQRRRRDRGDDRARSDRRRLRARHTDVPRLAPRALDRRPAFSRVFHTTRASAFLLHDL